MVVGKYKATFAESTHCIFDGHLDDPSFRSIAIQRIVSNNTNAITLDTSGIFPIFTHGGKEWVRITYNSPFYGKVCTLGRPFKEDEGAK